VTKKKRASLPSLSKAEWGSKGRARIERTGETASDEEMEGVRGRAPGPSRGGMPNLTSKSISYAMALSSQVCQAARPVEGESGSSRCSGGVGRLMTGSDDDASPHLWCRPHIPTQGRYLVQGVVGLRWIV